MKIFKVNMVVYTEAIDEECVQSWLNDIVSPCLSKYCDDKDDLFFETNIQEI